jgi:ketosteroid isomerase-like protein
VNVTRAGDAPRITGNLPAGGVEKIAALIDGYTAAWIDNDAEQIPDAVMRHLLPDAVIIPHHGVLPKSGDETIRAFWWPAGGPPTRVTRFVIENHEIGGEASFGFARGRFELEYVVDDLEAPQKYRNEGNSLMLVRQQADHTWRISHHIWNDPVVQPV